MLCELRVQIVAMLITYFLLVVQFVNPASSSMSSTLASSNYTVTTATYNWPVLEHDPCAPRQHCVDTSTA